MKGWFNFCSTNNTQQLEPLAPQLSALCFSKSESSSKPTMETIPLKPQPINPQPLKPSTHQTLNPSTLSAPEQHVKDLEQQQKETHEKLTSLDGLKRDVEGVLQLRATKEAIADLEAKIRQLKAATVAVRAGGLSGGHSRSRLTS